MVGRNFALFTINEIPLLTRLSRFQSAMKTRRQSTKSDHPLKVETAKTKTKRSKSLLVKKLPSLAESVHIRTADPWYNIFTKGDIEYNAYMATEWGFEKRGDNLLFENLSLEGAQSGLSWLTILRKREAYRRVFHGFEINKVANMTPSDVDAIVQTTGEPRDLVVRHRGKIEAVINNAQKIIQLRESEGDGAFDKFIWSFVACR
jgi:DNA-3-methyladenine glycosylase I